MNTKNNKRKRASIAKFYEVFINRLQTKDISEISVSDLCKDAGLNRSTFYANFIDIYDLAEKVCKHLEEDFLSLYQEEIKSRKSSHDFSRLLGHIKENQLFYKTYFKLGFASKLFPGYDIEMAEKCFDIKYIDYHIEFFRSGFNAILQKWLRDGCRETPEEIEGILKAEYAGRKI